MSVTLGRGKPVDRLRVELSLSLNTTEPAEERALPMHRVFGTSYGCSGSNATQGRAPKRSRWKT